VNDFNGTRKLTSLDFFPMKYHPHEASLQTRLIARGKKYIALLRKPTCQEYPLSIAVGENEVIAETTTRAKVVAEKINVRGRVMIGA
jgi:hypothetical protein